MTPYCTDVRAVDQNAEDELRLSNASGLPTFNQYPPGIAVFRPHHGRLKKKTRRLHSGTFGDLVGPEKWQERYFVVFQDG